jgi:hypothetical protein
VGFVGALNAWSIFKRRSDTGDAGEFVHFAHQDGEEHLGLQFLLTGLLSVYYDETRSVLTRPGFTSFPSHRPHDKKLGKIECSGFR